MSADDTKKAGSVQGEGDYVSAERFQKEEAAFAKSGKVDDKAREAADALDGPEAEELEAARRETAKGDPKHQDAAKT